MPTLELTLDNLRFSFFVNLLIVTMASIVQAVRSYFLKSDEVSVNGSPCYSLSLSCFFFCNFTSQNPLN
jgi:hypothetical protein